MHLWRTKPFPVEPVLRQFVALLVNRPFAWPNSAESYIWLVQRLSLEGFANEALALLRCVTRLRLEPPESLYRSLEEAIGTDGVLPRLTSRLSADASPEELVRLINEHGWTLAAAVGDELLALGEQRLNESYQLLDLSRGTAADGDWFSYSRVAVAVSNQDEFADATDVVVLLVRVVLDYWSETAPDRLRTFAVRHESSGRALLQRLRLYALSVCKTITGDELLDWAAGQGWPRQMELRPELYRVLRTHFATADATSKAAFIRALRDDAWWRSEFDEHQRHARFSLSQHLLTLDPSNVDVQAFAADEHEAHPDWRQQDRDGFLSRMEVSWGGEEPSPISAEQVLRWTAEEALATIGLELSQRAKNDEVRPLLGAVQQAARTDVGWGLSVLALASRETQTRVDLIEALCWGLHSTEVTPSGRLLLAWIVAAWEWPGSVTRTLGALVERMSRGFGTDARAELLNAFDHAGDLLFVRADDTPDSDLGVTDRVDRAVNHPAGHAATIWWNAANARDYIDGRFVLSIDALERERWERVLGDQRPATDSARVILGMALDRLSLGNFPWAERAVFPMFDPRAGFERAAQLWDGRLSHQRWSGGAIQGLLPALSPFFADSAALVPRRSHALGDWVALLAARRHDTNLSLALLQDFVRGGALDARQAYSDGLPKHLAELSPEARQAVWLDLLKPYWENRLTHMPSEFDAVELGGLVRWVVALPEVWEDAFHMLEATPGTAIPNADRVLGFWHNDDVWVREHPNNAVAVIRWLAQRRSIQWQGHVAVGLLETALEARAPRDAVIAAAEALAELPIPEAAILARRLREGGGSADQSVPE
jgi:hypothetical protein